MNIKELQKTLKECNCGIEFQKDKRKEYKGRYYLYAWPTGTCGDGSFLFRIIDILLLNPVILTGRYLKQERSLNRSL